MIPVNVDPIPMELRNIPNWVGWKLKTVNGLETKPGFWHENTMERFSAICDDNWIDLIPLDGVLFGDLRRG